MTIAQRCSRTGSRGGVDGRPASFAGRLRACLAACRLPFRDSQDPLLASRAPAASVLGAAALPLLEGAIGTIIALQTVAAVLRCPRVTLLGLAGPALAGEWPTERSRRLQTLGGAGPTGTDMSYGEPLRFPTADAIIALLSEDEIENVNKHEATVGHADTDEYLDLEHVEQGVRRGLGPPRPVCRVLPRKAVRETTWARIIAALDVDSAQAPSSGPRRCSTRNVPRRGPPQAKKSSASGE
jgi:hypothetical protein